jgi:formyl-CoA transferase
MFRAAEMLADAQYKARESIVRVMHPALGDIAMQNVAPKLSASPGKVHHPGPALGQHNTEVYRDILGLADGDMGRLAEKGII